jgi:hypothetical protein
VLRITTLELNSYLKIDSHYEVPIYMLDEVTDRLGNPLMICPKHRGGLAELRCHVRRHDQFREEEKLCRILEKQSLGDDDV